MPALFKFIADPGVAEFVLKGIAKFTPVAELNDPSELSPTLDTDAVKASLARLRREGYSEQEISHLQRQGYLLQRLAPRFQAVRVPGSTEEATTLIRSSFYDSISTLERLLSQTALEMSSKVGLFCLSQRYDALPMWAHYAANASGLAVQFRDLDTVFTGDETGVLRQPIQVRYDRERVGVSFEPQSHETLFFSKFQDWSYEQEVRIVLPLADCRQELVRGKPLYLYDFPPTCVARLILGWNMVSTKVNAVRELVGRLNPHVDVVQARFDRGRVHLGSA